MIEPTYPPSTAIITQSHGRTIKAVVLDHVPRAPAKGKSRMDLAKEVAQDLGRPCDPFSLKVILRDLIQAGHVRREQARKARVLYLYTKA